MWEMELKNLKTNKPYVVDAALAVTREQWGALEPRKLTKQKRPVKYVRMTQMPAQKPCERCTDCERDVRLKQEFDMRDAGWPDVQASFLVGDDGRVYEGRGWFYQVDKSGKNPDYEGKVYEILYLGPFNPGGKPPDVYIDAFRNIVDFGVKEKHIYKNFVILD